MAGGAQPFRIRVTQKSAFRLVIQPIAIAIVLGLAVRTAMRFYVIPSNSMVPTLVRGDHILVTPYHFQARPARGDVIVFRSRSDPRELMIKRVIGTPGDVVESRAGRVIVSGHAIAEPYLTIGADSGAILPQIIPADTYYLLGDNRADSLDSRSWGILPRDLVVGRARMILWSSEAGLDVQAGSLASAHENGSAGAAALHDRRLFKLIQ